MKRGRQSVVELATLPVSVTGKPKHNPPSELTDAQAQVWRDVVASVDGAKWLTRANYPVLIEYVRHVCRARTLESQIARFQTEWVKVEGGLERFDRLLSMADRETRAMTACARALRLTPQSQMHAKVAGRIARDASEQDGKLKPWD